MKLKWESRCVSVSYSWNLREERRELGRETGEEKEEDAGPGRERAGKRSRVEKEGGHWSRKGGLGRLTYSEKQCWIFPDMFTGKCDEGHKNSDYRWKRIYSWGRTLFRVTMQTTAIHDCSQTIGENDIWNFQVQVQRDFCEMVLWVIRAWDCL